MAEVKVTVEELSAAQIEAIAKRIEANVRTEIVAMEARLLAALRRSPLRPAVDDRALPDLDGPSAGPDPDGIPFDWGDKE